MEIVSEGFYKEAFYKALRPEERLTVSQWADKYRDLSEVSSAEPGKWRTSRTPYLREIMDVLSVHDPTTEIVFKSGSNLGDRVRS